MRTEAISRESVVLVLSSGSRIEPDLGTTRRTLADDRAGSQRPRPSPGDVWRRILSDAPTAFGRLVLAASLRDAETGRYAHPNLSALDADDADRMLRNGHQQVFQQWLGFSLAEQKADLGEYLGTVGGPRYALPYRSLVPPTAREVERQLYLTDLETLLELLRYESGGDASGPAA